MKKQFVKLLSIINLILLIACSNSTNNSGVSDNSSYQNVILVQGALDIEVDTLISALEDKKTERYASWVFHIGTINGKNGKNKVIVSRTEVGLVNASVATTIGIEKYKPTLIINQGTAGAHDPMLDVGDIVIGTNIVNMGSFTSERTLTSDQKNWKFMDAPQRLRDENDNFITNMRFYSTPEYVTIAKSVSYTNGNLVEGTIGSADQWNREAERINMLHSIFGTSAEEMETSAVAQVALAFKVPFLGIRVLSNAELHGGNYNPDTATWCNNYVIDIIKSL